MSHQSRKTEGIRRIYLQKRTVETNREIKNGGVLSEGYGHDEPGVCLGDGQTVTYLKDMDVTGLASVWAMARRRPREYRRKVDAATR